MKRECETCIKRKTIFCPTSMECMATDDMHHYQNRIMLLEENKQLKEIINEAIKKVDILRRNYAENVCPIPCTEIEDIDRTLKGVSE